jgi:hypothetical protein
MSRSAHCNRADVRWVLANRPFVFTGADPRTLAAEVPAHVLQATMRPQIERFDADLKTWASFDNSWTQRYAVESAVRMLYTLEHGEVISKRAALEWAAETLPAEWRDLLEQVRRDRFVEWNASPDPVSVERAVSIVAYVQERARGIIPSG